MYKKSNIFITGSSGMLGSALVNQLQKRKYINLFYHNSKQLDLMNYYKLKNFFQINRPDYVFHLANKVYGIGGNSQIKFPMLNDNLIMNSNLLKVCEEFKIKKILFAGSSSVYHGKSIYNKKEGDIFFKTPHISELYYGLSKRIMLEQLESLEKSSKIKYSYAILNNMYGIKDNFDIQKGHVVPSLIHKTYIAKKENKDLFLWGNGNEKRCFLYSIDASLALIRIMKSNVKVINVSSINEYQILDLINIIVKKLNFKNKIIWNSKYNGVKRRHLNIDLLKNTIKFSEKFSLQEGIEETIDWFCKNYKYTRK